jgi:enoyl-CoA hydratase/carnithine racemase
MHTRLEVHNDVARLTMDDGRVNALSEPLLREIEARLDETRDARVTVLLGRPGIFSAGFDMATFARGTEATVAMLQAGIEVIEKMLSHPHPIVTGCAGHAFPMGAFLMLCADLRFGVPGPFKIGMNEVAIGVTVPRFALALAKHRLSPAGYARISTGAMFSPEEAVRFGYLDDLVPEHELEVIVQTAAQGLCSLDADAYRRTKARLNGPLLDTIRALARPDAIAAELDDNVTQRYRPE